MTKFFSQQRINRTTRHAFVVLWFFGCWLGFSLTAAAAANDGLKEDLKQQINELQQQIDSYRSNIQELQQQGKSLKQEISLFDSKIKSSELEVKRTNLAIRQTEVEIGNKNLAMSQGETKLNREKEILGECVRALYEYDERGLLEMVLSNNKLSDIFDEMNSLEAAQEKIQESMVNIRQMKVGLEDEKAALEDKREELNGLKVLQQIQARALAGQQDEKKNLLAQTKGQESNYTKLINKVKADAESIRQQLYLLEGVGLSMPLYQAYQYAKQAGGLTGVRPAFLLAVLKKESSWGERAGTGSWRRDMHTRDKQAFVTICEKLGFDPDKMAVSRKPSYGWGGAMGPAQFLPSVWLAYESRVAQLTGHDPPNPWDIEDAFVAAGIKMAQAGANAQTPGAEWKAAQIYFAGKRWNSPTYYFYGDQVMELAGVIQSQLDIIAK